MNCEIVVSIVCTVGGIMGWIVFKLRSKERELRREIQTITALRDQQVAQYEKDLKAANARLAAAKLQVQVLQGSAKNSIAKDIQGHRGKVWHILQSAEKMTLFANYAVIIGFIGTIGTMIATALIKFLKYP